MHFSNTKQRGFTIVELLIVIVVIAILAAITIVAYNGIQNRAKDSAVRTAASQAGRKALAYGPLNGDLFPVEATFRTDLGLPADTEAATYDYYASNDRRSFCLSVTNTTLSPARSYAQTQSAGPVEGRCVKNLVVNPSFEAGNVTGWGGTGSIASYTSAPNSSAPAGSRVMVLSRTNSGDAYSSYYTPGTLTANTAYTLSYWVWSTVAVDTAANNLFRNFNSGSCCSTLQNQRLITTLAPVRYTHSGVSSANPTTGAQIVVRPTATNGEAVYYDGFMVTEGTTRYAYGDGDSPNWSWVDGASSSASFGPSVPQ